MISAFEENELLDLMSDVELLLKYRNYTAAAARLQELGLPERHGGSAGRSADRRAT